MLILRRFCLPGTRYLLPLMYQYVFFAPISLIHAPISLNSMIPVSDTGMFLSFRFLVQLLIALVCCLNLVYWCCSIFNSVPCRCVRRPIVGFRLLPWDVCGCMLVFFFFTRGFDFFIGMPRLKKTFR